jgi:AcrR family transcriptional regulator
MAEIGQREREKHRRRTAMLSAAFALFTERGYEATTTTDIAERAGVSERSVRLYFPAKQDLAVNRFTTSMDRLVLALQQRPEGVSTPDVIADYLHAKEAASDEDGLREGSRLMFIANPSLRALRWAYAGSPLAALTQAYAADLALPPEHQAAALAASATQAILLDLADLPPGPEHTAAVGTALTMLDGVIQALSTSYAAAP